MQEFLFSSVKHTLPYYLLATLLGEALLFVKERKGLVLEIAVAAFICIALTTLAQLQSDSSWAAQNRQVLLAVVNFLSVLMPLAVLVVANQLLVRIRKTIIKHASLLVVVLITMFIWPLWVLYVTCATGLDCL